MNYALILLVVDAVASPVAPWWGPMVEHIIQALIVSCVPVAATIIRGVISHREHVQNLEVARKAVEGRDEIKAAIEVVHNDVKTANALSMGQLADAAETRRVDDIPAANRTAAEQGHLDAVPPKS